jgi:hypothetical protein
MEREGCNVKGRNVKGRNLKGCDLKGCNLQVLRGRIGHATHNDLTGGGVNTRVMDQGIVQAGKETITEAGGEAIEIQAPRSLMIRPRGPR